MNPPITFLSRLARGPFSLALVAVMLVAFAHAASAQTVVRRSSGVKDFGKSKASERNQGPKSKSYHDRGKTESQKYREMYEERWDELTGPPQHHLSGGYCMYGLDGELIHAPAGRACARTQTENDENEAKLSENRTTLNSIGQHLGKCLKGDCENGKGLYQWPDRTRYKGAFKDSRQHGRGVMLMPSGVKYSGDWRFGMRWGRGMGVSADGTKRTGDWVKNNFVVEKARSKSGGSYAKAKARAAKKPSVRWPSLRSPADEVGGGSKDAAVVIGIGDYAHVPAVGNADDNAGDWYGYLVKSRGVPVERVTLLLDEDATLEEMQAATMDAASQVSKGGTLWFVFIGHGAPSRDGSDGLLIGYDAQQKARSLGARSFARSELIEMLEDSSAESINVFLDACFSGKDRGGEQLVAGLQPLAVTSDKVSSDKRTMLMTAAHSNEFAGPLPGGDRPAFSYLALGGLRGWADDDEDGSVTAQELHDYVSRAMQTLVHDRKQRPTLAGKGGRELVRSANESGPDFSDLVMATSGKRRQTSRHPAAPR